MATRAATVQIFSETYSEAMKFLETDGFRKEPEDDGLVYKLKYTKEDLQFLFVLEIRDVVVDHFVVLLPRGGSRQPVSVPLLSLLSEAQVRDPELTGLNAEVNRLYKDGKFYRRVWLERDTGATHLLLQRLALFVATVVRKYRHELVQRLRSQHDAGGE